MMSSPLCFSMPRERETPPWAGLSVLLLAGFVTIFDLFVVNVAIPSIQAGLGQISPRLVLLSPDMNSHLAFC
jgi:hypothetical protein